MARLAGLQKCGVLSRAGHRPAPTSIPCILRFHQIRLHHQSFAAVGEQTVVPLAQWALPDPLVLQAPLALRVQLVSSLPTRN